MKHALFSPSDSNIWIECDGYIHLKKEGLVTKFPIPMAEVGQEKHAIVAHYLHHIFIDKDPEEDFYKVDEDIKNDYLIPLANLIRSYGEEDILAFYIEETFRASDSFFGTPDLIFVVKKPNEEIDVVILDVKAGRIPVSVYKNTQLVAYQMLFYWQEILKGKKYVDIKKVNYKFCIFQPFSKNKISYWFADDIPEKRGCSTDLYSIALNLEGRINAPESKEVRFNQGRHCLYCPAKLHCPLMKEKQKDFIKL